MNAVKAKKDELDSAIAKETEERTKATADYEKKIADYEASATEWTNQINAITDEYNKAQAIIEDSKNVEVAARAAAEEIVLEAEKRSVFLKEAALKESDKGQYIKTIEEKEKKIKEMEKERDDLNAKIKDLESSIKNLEKKVASGELGGGAASGPKEYCIETVNHNDIGEVNDEGIAKVLAEKSKDGWNLFSVINDDGGKLQGALGGEATASLSMGSFTSKEDRVIMIFERPKKA